MTTKHGEKRVTKKHGRKRKMEHGKKKIGNRKTNRRRIVWNRVPSNLARERKSGFEETKA